MLFYFATCGVVLLLIVLQLKISKRRGKNLPPGPMQISFHPGFIRKWLSGVPVHELLYEMSFQYGPIILSSFGSQTTVVLQDYDHIKEALSHKDWIERVYPAWLCQRSFGKEIGIFLIGGENWKEMRHFTTRTLRGFGFGRRGMQDLIRVEVDVVVENVASRISRGDNIFAVKSFFTVPTLNVLMGMLASDRMEADDERMIRHLELIEKAMKKFSIGSAHALTYHISAPFLAKIVSYFSAHVRGDEFIHYHKLAQELLREYVDERRAAGEYKSEPQNFVDAFLFEIDAHKNGPKSDVYTDEQLIMVLLDLILAGAETTSNTLEFAILYMILHPEVQTKVQQEIDEVIGFSGQTTYADRQKMPYTSATLFETYRMASVSPATIRSPVKDTVIGKYTVPKESIGIINLYAMNMDPKQWETPFEFKPERFLDADFNVINGQKILALGTGKRSCVGEAMANASIFVFFVSLLQRFTFKISPNHPVPTFKAVNGLTLSPEPFHCLVESRVLEAASAK